MRKGFISSYYLVIFLVCTGLITMILLNIENRLRTAANLTRVNEYLACEEIAVKGLKCALRNDALTDGTYTLSGVTYSVEANEKQAYITISEPVYEVLSVYYDNETGRIYDYDVIRTETPF